MLAALLTVLFDGVAYGSLLFVISVGMSVTMGLMNFINLAHGVFAMFGGYLAITLMRRWGVPFVATLPIVLIAFAAIGVVVERLLYRRVFRLPHLDQVLFTIGLTFIATASATWMWGPSQQAVVLPAMLQGQVRVLGLDLGAYRLFLIGVVVAITVALHLLVAHTRLGAQLRAAVDHRDAAAGLGIPVEHVLSGAFALGCGLAALGGALGIDLLGLDPRFAFKYVVYFLLVVVVGGEGSIFGSAVAAVALGMFDVVGKYYFPGAGGFFIYALMVVLLLVYPHGLFRRRR
jgi:branched-chain amino acid transport system permease protein